MKRVLIAALVGAIALAGCSKGGGGDDGGDATATCEPGTSPLALTAKDGKFDTDCLAIAADTAFAVDFSNDDSFEHNFSIYETEGGKDIFKGRNQTDGKITYDVAAIAAGEYYFQCDVHPDMNGKFISAGA